MPSNTQVPGVCAGPIPNSSQIPCEFIFASKFGYSKIAFTSDANIS